MLLLATAGAVPGMQVLCQLPALTSLDLSGYDSTPTVNRGNSSIIWQEEQATTLLSLISGWTSQQQQQQQPSVTHIATGTSSSSRDSSTTPAAAIFRHLLHLNCSGANLVYSALVWQQLQRLLVLDLSWSKGFKGEGLVQLQHLQALTLMGESEGWKGLVKGLVKGLASSRGAQPPSQDLCHVGHVLKPNCPLRVRCNNLGR